MDQADRMTDTPRWMIERFWMVHPTNKPDEWEYCPGGLCDVDVHRAYYPFYGVGEVLDV